MGRDRNAKISKSILLFLFTGILFLVQHVPYLGVFLMILGAPLWSVVTINLGFLLMAKEAWDGTLPRAVVVLPFLYFSIYAGITIAGHKQLFRLRQEIAQNNQGVHVAFDPKQNDLVVETKVVKGSTSPLGNVPEELVEAYDIPVAYGDNGNPRIASHVSYRVVAKKTCDAIGHSDPNVVSLAFQQNDAFNVNLCLLRQPEDPTKPVLPASGRISETAIDPTVAQNLQSYQEKEHTNELRRFHDLVTELALPDWQFPFLLQHPELTAAEAPAMVQALQRAEEVTTVTRHGRERTSLKCHNNNIRFVLSDMIVRLPEDAYAPLVPQLVEAARADAKNTESGVGWSLQSQAPAFMFRLGDAAPAEMADLFAATLQAEHASRDAQTTAVLGLCRAGAEYAPKVKGDLSRLFASTSRYDGGSMYLHSALYVTLLRMGMKDAVVNDPTDGRRDRVFQWYQDKLANVTPASPKEACVAIR